MLEPYVTVDDLKRFLSITGSNRDADVELAIAAASSAIDAVCGDRSFRAAPTDDDDAEARYFTPTRPSTIDVDDLVGVVELAIDVSGRGSYSVVWEENRDYVLEPENALQHGRPFERLKVHPYGRRYLPLNLPRAVRVTARFGWPATYPGAVQMTQTIASKLLKRKEAPFGIAQFGAELAMRLIVNDPDFPVLLGDFVRDPVLA